MNDTDEPALTIHATNTITGQGGWIGLPADDDQLDHYQADVLHLDEDTEEYAIDDYDPDTPLATLPLDPTRHTIADLNLLARATLTQPDPARLDHALAATAAQALADGRADDPIAMANLLAQADRIPWHPHTQAARRFSQTPEERAAHDAAAANGLLDALRQAGATDMFDWSAYGDALAGQGLVPDPDGVLDTTRPGPDPDRHTPARLDLDLPTPHPTHPDDGPSPDPDPSPGPDLGPGPTMDPGTGIDTGIGPA